MLHGAQRNGECGLAAARMSTATRWHSLAPFSARSSEPPTEGLRPPGGNDSHRQKGPADRAPKGRSLTSPTPSGASRPVPRATDSISHKTDSISHKTDSISHKTDSISHKTDSISHKTDSISQEIRSVSQVPAPVFDATDSVCQKIRSLTQETKPASQVGAFVSQSTESVSRARGALAWVMGSAGSPSGPAPPIRAAKPSYQAG